VIIEVGTEVFSDFVESYTVTLPISLGYCEYVPSPTSLSVIYSWYVRKRVVSD
jgi:hypothetical protein